MDGKSGGMRSDMKHRIFATIILCIVSTQQSLADTIRWQRWPYELIVPQYRVTPAPCGCAQPDPRLESLRLISPSPWREDNRTIWEPLKTDEWRR